MEEVTSATPASSMTFKYWQSWAGDTTPGLFTASCPDNIMIDAQGGVWFGTDGNWGASGKKSSDAVYYLDLDPAHKLLANPTYGLAFRIVGGPSDAEMSGPAFSPKMSTLFFSVQHPGEDNYSSWPPR
jgi:secreted PhoX family phosphatase